MNNRQFSLRYVTALVLIFSVGLQSCDNDPVIVPIGADGFFIINEGAFGNSNASLSFYDRETNQVTNDVFAAKNSRLLGDQAQSMSVWEGKGYIVVQNSGKVEVIDAEDYTSIKTITDGIESPRYFVGYSSTKGYVSDWGFDGVTGTVKVIDLTTNTVTKSIPTGQGANRMLLVDNKLYVSNSGGYGYDNTVKIIDTGTDAVTASITVGDNPNSLQRDKDGNIWVVCAGVLAYNEDFSIDENNSTPSSIVKVTGDAKTLEMKFTTFTYSTAGQLGISPEGDQLYVNFDGQLYKIATSATTLPTSAFLTKSYYGFAVDPFNGDVIGGILGTPGFSSAGKIEIYNQAGMLKNSFDVGIAPNGCAFK